MRIRSAARRAILGIIAAGLIAAMAACGEGVATRSSDDATISKATGFTIGKQLVLTEADAGRVIETDWFVYDIGLPNKKGPQIQLAGDDASTLRWRFAERPDSLILEWSAVDGESAFETGDLIGDPATAAKVLEFRGSAGGEATVIFELVEQDPTERIDPPAKRLTYTFQVLVKSTTGNTYKAPGNTNYRGRPV